MRKNDGDWFHLSSDYPTHRKTFKLCRLLACDTADAYPVRLMCWLRDQENVDGNFADEGEIEQAARWGGDEGKLVKALRESGIISGLTYHNWATKGGKGVSSMLARRVHDDCNQRADGQQNDCGRMGKRESKRESKKKTEKETESESGLTPDAPAHDETGWHPNREAIHIAQRWAQINPKIFSPEKASHHFAGGLEAGIDAKALMEAVEKHRGRKPFEIVDSLKVPLAGKSRPRKGGAVLDLDLLAKEASHAQD